MKQISRAARISTLIQPTLTIMLLKCLPYSVASVDYGVIKSCFLQATRREEFQNKWMSADTWAKLIAKYCIRDSTIFNGTILDKCLSLRQNEHLRTQMDMRKDTTEDHIGVFREVLRKHGKQ